MTKWNPVTAGSKCLSFSADAAACWSVCSWRVSRGMSKVPAIRANIIGKMRIGANVRDVSSQGGSKDTCATGRFRGQKGIIIVF